MLVISSENETVWESETLTDVDRPFDTLQSLTFSGVEEGIASGYMIVVFCEGVSEI